MGKTYRKTNEGVFFERESKGKRSKKNLKREKYPLKTKILRNEY